MATNDTTLEEAKRCPKCQTPGNQISSTKRVRPHSGRQSLCTVYTYACPNERCKWFEDRWIVQVNSDGTIPVRTPGDKDYPSSDRLVNMGERYMDMLKAEEERGEAMGTA